MFAMIGSTFANDDSSRVAEIPKGSRFILTNELKVPSRTQDLYFYKDGSFKTEFQGNEACTIQFRGTSEREQIFSSPQEIVTGLTDSLLGQQWIYFPNSDSVYAILCRGDSITIAGMKSVLSKYFKVSMPNDKDTSPIQSKL